MIGEQARLVTQIYCPGEALNGRDRPIARLKAAGRDPAVLVARPASPRLEASARGYARTAVLDQA